MAIENISFLSISVFSNELWKYFLLLFLIILSFYISKIFKYIIKNYLIKFAEKTSFEFDDILIKSINPPISMIVLAAFFQIATSNFQGSIKLFFDKIVTFLWIIPFVYFMIKFSTEIVGFYLKKAQKTGKKVNEAAIDLLMTIIRIALFLVGILLILSNLGYDIGALLAGLGVGGLAFALAAQDILKNFFAGISLIFDKTFNKNERVKFEGVEGIINEIGLRTTKIKTYDNTIITVPNSSLAENLVENVSKAKKVKVRQTFGLVYGTSPQKLKKAKQIIEKAIKSEKMADHENYWIWFDDFGSYSLDIKVIYYGIMDQDSWPDKVLFKERINFEILNEFEKAGIEMAFPTQTIELKKVK
jgi:MscS family membrane protein